MLTYLPYFFSDRYRKQTIFFSWPQSWTSSLLTPHSFRFYWHAITVSKTLSLDSSISEFVSLVFQMLSLVAGTRRSPRPFSSWWRQKQGRSSWTAPKNRPPSWSSWRRMLWSGRAWRSLWRCWSSTISRPRWKTPSNASLQGVTLCSVHAKWSLYLIIYYVFSLINERYPSSYFIFHSFYKCNNFFHLARMQHDQRIDNCLSPGEIIPLIMRRIWLCTFYVQLISWIFVWVHPSLCTLASFYSNSLNVEQWKYQNHLQVCELVNYN